MKNAGKQIKYLSCLSLKTASLGHQTVNENKFLFKQLITLQMKK